MHSSFSAEVVDQDQRQKLESVFADRFGGLPMGGQATVVQGQAKQTPEEALMIEKRMFISALNDNSNKWPFRKTGVNTDCKGFCDIFGHTFLQLI